MVRVPLTMYIYKLNNDVAAGYLYSLGCSLIHLVLFFMIMIIRWPDLKAA